MNKGFTLIELLIVIAIIGILASTVVVSLGDQTSKASQAKIKSELSQIPTVVVAHYISNGNKYDNVCEASSGTNNPPTLEAILVSLRAGRAEVNVFCDAKNNDWVVSYFSVESDLTENPHYCIDSQIGQLQTYEIPPSGATNARGLTERTSATAGEIKCKP